MEQVFLALLILCVLVLVYALYQFIRNDAVFKVRAVWIKEHDDRWDKYSYDFMFSPNKHNWYGLRYPKDSHYP